MKRILGPCLALSILVTLFPAPAAFADQLTVSLVNVIETSRWSPPSPDPIGLAKDPALDGARRVAELEGEIDGAALRGEPVAPNARDTALETLAGSRKFGRHAW